MYKKMMFEKKINALTFFIFFGGVFVILFFDWLPIWAGVMASAFVAVTLRQFLVGYTIDIFASLIVFGLLFVTNSIFHSPFWTGVLVLVGAGYLFIRQCVEIYLTHREAKHNEHSDRSFDDDPED